jgi:SM-20-related protein
VEIPALLPLALNPALDVRVLAAEYAALGRVRIHSLLAEDAARLLHADIIRRDDWRQMFVGTGGVVELDREARSAMALDAAAAIDRDVHERASLGFQYRYEGLRVPAPEELAPDNSLAVFADFMASADVLDFLQRVMGCSTVTFGEGMATAYAAGDFLTCHDDAVPGRNRLAAFVLGMTPQWRPEWGGLLLFHNDDDSQAQALVPRFNTLDLFAVPRRHSVSYVTASALGRRLALTGWLRPSEVDPAYS